MKQSDAHFMKLLEGRLSVHLNDFCRCCADNLDVCCTLLSIIRLSLLCYIVLQVFIKILLILLCQEKSGIGALCVT